MAVQVHGDLLEVRGVGLLLQGPSGIGKSETALELIARGHRLVADDLVRIERHGDRLIGRAPDLIRHHIEIRGLGILSVPDLYGPGSVLDEARVELVCRLEAWRSDDQYERVGLKRACEEICGIELPRVTLPARTVANLATLAEVAVRDHLNRCAGDVGVARLDARVRREARR